MNRSRFNLSHYNLLSFDMGKIYPIDVTEVLPGDSFKKVTTALIRMQPMLAPIMHPVKVRIHHWFVPNRLIWDDWEDFITGGPQNTSTPEFPKVNQKFAKGSLGDYFGLPTATANNIKVNALPFRAYNLIFNEFYRDEDLVDERVISTSSGIDNTTDLTLARASWRKDYFTTARPWTQKGQAIGVPIHSTSGQLPTNTNLARASFKLTTPLFFSGPIPPEPFPSTGQIPITVDNTGISYQNLPMVPGSVARFTVSSGGTIECSPANPLIYNKLMYTVNFSLPLSQTFEILFNDGTNKMRVGFLKLTHKLTDTSNSDNPNRGIYHTTSIQFVSADNIVQNVEYRVPISQTITGTLESKGSFDIRDLRAASALQRFNEHRSLFGSRYSEYLRFLGVKSSDARLQRPEFLGGGSQLLQISEVLQTGVDENNEGVGNFAGHGITAVRSNRFKKFFEEHGYIISLMFVLPANLYSQGINKMWSPTIKEDFFQPELASIGEEEVLASELYADGSTADNSIFGYSHRYQRYRTEYSKIHGDFRDTLDYWHLSRKFQTHPVLNSSFLQANPDKRIFAEQNNDSLLAMVSHNIKALRIVPKYAKNILK